eukprot:GHVS01078478.1.p1 GENE.GHVS01078478.1~~GHVS01078478.1.p1  ORF type:complete len:478 (-),score=91.85 GHVS01078478.1:35-1468(-)
MLASSRCTLQITSFTAFPPPLLVRLLLLHAKHRETNINGLLLIPPPSLLMPQILALSRGRSSPPPPSLVVADHSGATSSSSTSSSHPCSSSSSHPSSASTIPSTSTLPSSQSPAGVVTSLSQISQQQCDLVDHLVDLITPTSTSTPSLSVNDSPTTNSGRKPLTASSTTRRAPPRRGDKPLASKNPQPEDKKGGRMEKCTPRRPVQDGEGVHLFNPTSASTPSLSVNDMPTTNSGRAPLTASSTSSDQVMSRHSTSPTVLCSPSPRRNATNHTTSSSTQPGLSSQMCSGTGDCGRAGRSRHKSTGSVPRQQPSRLARPRCGDKPLTSKDPQPEDKKGGLMEKCTPSRPVQDGEGVHQEAQSAAIRSVSTTDSQRPVVVRSDPLSPPPPLNTSDYGHNIPSSSNRPRAPADSTTLRSLRRPASQPSLIARRPTSRTCKDAQPDDKKGGLMEKCTSPSPVQDGEGAPQVVAITSSPHYY